MWWFKGITLWNHCLPNKLSIWQNPRLNRKFLRTLHLAALELFCLTHQMRCKNPDVQGKKPVRNDAGELCLKRVKQATWKEHYACLSNVEFNWIPDSLTEVYPSESLAPCIPLELVSKAIKLMKCCKAAGTSLIIAEMLKASGIEQAQQIHHLDDNIIIHLGKIPTEWEESIIVSLYKGKDVTLERGFYGGLKLLDQVMKVLERVAENFLWHQVRINDIQFGFMPGCSTTDTIFIVCQS